MQTENIKINKKWAVFGVVLAVAFLVCLYLYDRHQKMTTPNSGSTFVMNTVISQQVYGIKSEEAMNEVIDRMKAYEQVCSYYIESSQLSQINQNAGVSYVKVDSQLFELIKLSKQYAAETDGLFDITVAPLVSLWGVTGKNPRVPSQSEINAALDLIDYNDILIKEDTSEVMLARAGMKIDLGGIAKGYICGVAKQVYQEYGVKAAWISIGGNIYTYGEKPDGTPYSIGVAAPVENRQSLLGRVNVGEYVIASSGGYERYFEENGQIYHHIFDVRTGYPSQSDLAGVTVLCKEGAKADMLSTYYFVAGSDAVKAALNDSEVGIIACDNAGNVYVSDWLKDSFELTNEHYRLWEGK